MIGLGALLARVVVPGWATIAAAVAVAVALGGAILYVKSLRADLAAARATIALREQEIAAAERANKTTLEALAETRRFYERTVAAVAQDRDAAIARARRAEKLKSEARDAEDGPPAPVLIRIIDGLRSPSR